MDLNGGHLWEVKECFWNLAMDFISKRYPVENAYVSTSTQNLNLILVYFFASYHSHDYFFTIQSSVVLGTFNAMCLCDWVNLLDPLYIPKYLHSNLFSIPAHISKFYFTIVSVTNTWGIISLLKSTVITYNKVLILDYNIYFLINTIKAPNLTTI